MWQGHQTRKDILAVGRALEAVANRLDQVEEPIESKNMSTTYQAIHNGVVGPHTVTDVFQDSDHPDETWEQFTARHARHVYEESTGTEYHHYP